MQTADLARLDRAHLWHPFTQQRGWAAEPPVLIERAEGCTLFDTDGNAYLDGVSSLWCNVHGHRHPAIDAAVRAQLDRVAHTTMLGLSHPGRPPCSPSAWWRSRPGGSSACSIPTTARRRPRSRSRWPSSTGSTGVEPARTGFICLRDAYHGDTVGSVSVGGIELFHSLFEPLLFDSWHAEPGDLHDMRSLLEAHGEQVAAGDRGAARAGRRRDARAPRRLLARRAPPVRRTRCPADLRRGGDRLRPHRHDVRRRAGGRRAGPAVRRQGTHRAATCRLPRRSPPGRSTTPSSASMPSSRPSSTATRTPATRWPAPPRWRRSRCSSPSAPWSAWLPS